MKTVKWDLEKNLIEISRKIVFNEAKKKQLSVISNRLEGQWEKI